ncbi:22941_t:CDS:1, partial [Gigaspora margarita]
TNDSRYATDDTKLYEKYWKAEWKKCEIKVAVKAVKSNIGNHS